MYERISETQQCAGKPHRCDSCLGMIAAGARYWRTVMTDGARVVTYREHAACRTASEIVASHLHGIDLEAGMPRVWEMERDDRETVLAEAPGVARVLWPETCSQEA